MDTRLAEISPAVELFRLCQLEVMAETIVVSGGEPSEMLNRLKQELKFEGLKIGSTIGIREPEKAEWQDKMRQKQKRKKSKKRTK